MADEWLAAHVRVALAQLALGLASAIAAYTLGTHIGHTMASTSAKQSDLGAASGSVNDLDVAINSGWVKEEEECDEWTPPNAFFAPAVLLAAMLAFGAVLTIAIPRSAVFMLSAVVGGPVGASLRFALSCAMQSPRGTFVANVLGVLALSIAVGVFRSANEKSDALFAPSIGDNDKWSTIDPIQLLPVLSIGICGR